MISGDNGGAPGGAGNNCPDIDKFCMRGQKATLWEGGIRNNALFCSKTMLPQHKLGTTYNGGMVHLLDMHATLEELGGAAAQKGARPLDGSSVWRSIIQGEASPRNEFVVNIDPCSGHGACQGVEAGI